MGVQMAMLARGAALLSACAALAACGGGSGAGGASAGAARHSGAATTPGGTASQSTTGTAPGAPGPGGGAPLGGSRSGRPNIVFVLTDDLSLDLLPYMPHVQAMERHGLTFTNYFVSDSLCCPSRASILTGQLPHDTHVFSNFGPGGGFHVFYRRGEARHTFAVALQRAGYRTALMGKYLNGYLARRGRIADGAQMRVPAHYVPPGWTRWDVAGWGYPEFNYTLDENGVRHRFGHRPSDYLTDVLARMGTGFIRDSVAAQRPFMLELATFAPHGPFVPAPRDAHDFPGLRAPRPPSFNRLPTDAPNWLVNRGPLTRRQVRRVDTVFRRRAQSVQAVDRMIGAIEAELTADGVAQNTYLVFSSDNGMHTGEYRLLPGKLTAFDTDIHVPLVVVGPGVPAGAHTGAVAENIDLAETFAAIGGTSVSGDGHSLLALLHGERPANWRDAALVEHHGPDLSGGDPDFQRFGAGNPRTYEAMRTPAFLYVEYDDGEREYYDLPRDPFELHNIAGRLPATRLARLHRALTRLERCHGAAACWRAMHP